MNASFSLNTRANTHRKAFEKIKESKWTHLVNLYKSNNLEI